MKYFYLPIPILFLFLIGCSTTYRISNYSSKEEFYKDINNTIKNRSTDIVANDSSYTLSEGSKIKDDTLYTIVKIPYKKIPLRDTREIKYFGETYEEPSAYIWTKSGKELNAENVKIMPDSSLQFTDITSDHIPLDRIKEISYKTRGIGIPLGFAGGILVGGLIGSTGWIINIKEGGQPPFLFNAGTSILYGATIGAVIGSIIGYIIGWNYVYWFKR